MTDNLQSKTFSNIKLAGAFALCVTAVAGTIAAEKMGYIKVNELSQQQKDMLERRCAFGCG